MDLGFALKSFYSHLRTTQWVRVGVILFLVLLGVGFGVGVSIGTEHAQSAADADEKRRAEIFNQWQMDLVSHFTRAEALAAAIAAYSTANALTPTNWSSPYADRLRLDNTDAFNTMCNDMVKKVPGIYTAALLSGGVVAGSCPPGAMPVGFATIQSPNYAPAFGQMFKNNAPMVTGPTQMAAINNSIAINSWYPIYVNASTTPRSKATFWGTSLVMVELTRFVQYKNMSKLVTDHGLDYALWYTEDYAITGSFGAADVNASAASTGANGTSATSLPTTVPAQTMVGTHVVHESIEGNVATRVIRSSTADAATMVDIVQNGARIRLPAAQLGKIAYLSLLPIGGPVSNKVSPKIIATIVVSVFIGSGMVVLFLFTILFAVFVFHHRHAPAPGSSAFFAALTLRGAQPIADHAPLEAVRMFAEFTAQVRHMAAASGCYAICDVGDRTVYVAAKKASAVAQLCKAVVSELSISADCASGPETSRRKGQGNRRESNKNTNTQDETVSNSVRHSVSRRATMRTADSRGASYANRNETDASTAHHTSSSFIGAAVCRPSAALHAATARCVYDAAKDGYFFGNAAHVGKLCGALDGTKGGEVGWTAAAEEVCGSQCRALETSAVSCHIISEGAEVVLHVASLWKETGDERDNEDPSVAMAALADAYVRRMTVIVSEGRHDARQKKHNKKGAEAAAEGGGSSSGNGSSNKSADAAAVTRSATVLHIALLDGGRLPLDIVRRVVAEEKGAVVSGHENVIVATFNLLTPGGHHQVRAADAVVRLRAALPNTPFVCSLHHGKVSALIADGLVVCSGEAVSAGHALLDRAVALRSRLTSGSVNSKPSPPTSKHNSVTIFPPSYSEEDRSHMRLKSPACGIRPTFSFSATTDATREKKFCDAMDAASSDLHGLCLLYCHSELSSTYECEAVDVVTSNPTMNDPAPQAEVKGRVAYRLAHRKDGKAAADDEWMYQLRDEEGLSPFAAVNAVFDRLAAGQQGEAQRLFEEVCARRSVTEGINGVGARSARLLLKSSS